MKNAVLVVDDSELIRNIMSKALEDEYTIIEAQDGKEAIERVIMNNNIVCILLDLNMPNYDGFVVLDYFKENNLFKKIPIFIISGDDSKKTIERAFKYDIIDMLNKPFSMKNIKNAVERAINLSSK